ncbi:HTH-type transcriptional repressor CytR [Posidoniimonas polymericola]|uniref:HTH-type transcriptional repressor CytR n=1 Tax=Posidoniimonas polymericola TaxID=2528002 RepID=A0A5C5XUR0_9BACT|nr:LacI family DNA-binding transcriptional regulator [Posidoniimonas polymericola]TWT66239.1 HTH-type transcriptional repressor CytR [Posidoniimonas polymericola]
MAPADRRPARLKDVAAAAGVSKTTASRILNGDTENFGKETCARVKETASRLGWRRNLLIDGMQKGRSKTVGVMIPPHDSFWVGVLAGIHITLAEADYLPITIWIGDCREFPEFNDDDTAGVEQINRLLDRRVDGLILWPSFAVAYYDHYRELIERRVPVVSIDHRLPDEVHADSIETDELAGATCVAEHLIGLGHKQIACFGARETEWQGWSVRRRQLFEEAVASRGGSVVRSWKTNESGSDGLEVAKQVLTSSPRPTAVFAVSDHQARILYRAAADLGLRVPKDVSIVGYADLDFADELSPPLTTMRQQPIEIGRQAAQAVLERQADEASMATGRVISVRPELVVRASTSRP